MNSKHYLRIRKARKERELARLTLRDQFAMAALSGLCSRAPYEFEAGKLFNDRATTAYEYADAMLEERNR